MITVIKSTFVLSILTVAAMYVLGWLVRPMYRPVSRDSAKATVLALGSLSLGQIYVAFAALTVAVISVVKNRTNAAGLMIFLIVTLPAVGFMAMAGSLQLVNISVEACVTLGAMIAAFMWKKGAGVRYSSADLPAFGIMLVLTFISARDSSITNVMRVTVQILLNMFLPYHLFKKALNGTDAVRNTFVFVIAAAMAVACIAIFESVKVWPMYQTYSAQFGIFGLSGVKMRGGMLRAAGPLMNPPMSSAPLALCFVTAFASQDLFKSTRAHKIVLAVIAVGLFMMQSRVGWLGAIAGSLGVLMSRRGIKGMFPSIAILSVALAGVYGLASLNERAAGVLGFSSDAKGSLEYRSKLYDRGVELVGQHPMIGQPLSAVTVQMEDLRQGEGIIDFTNGYLGVALFAGLIGLAVFAGGIASQAVASYRARRSSRTRGWGSLSDLGLGVAVTAGVMFPYIPTDSRVLLVVLLLFALSNTVASTSARGRRIDPAPRREPFGQGTVALSG